MVLSSLLCTRDKYLRLSKLTVQNFTHIFIDQKPKSYRSKNTMNVDKSYEVEPLVVPEKLRTLDHGRPWSDDQFASTRLSSNRDMSR